MFIFLMFIAVWRRIKLAAKSQELRGLTLAAFLIWNIGAIFYHFHEGWSWVNSYYFCAVTLSTIGYGDFTPTTNLSKIFTIFYIIIGIGIIGLFISELAKVSRQERVKLMEEVQEIEDSPLKK
jgi:voltage-gated potassium channel